MSVFYEGIGEGVWEGISLVGLGFFGGCGMLECLRVIGVVF